jgi:bacterioferritin-associated ferredoxin
MQKKPKSEIICRCNNVPRKTIEDAILNGCDTLNKIFDETTAGIGPCGGSCRRKLKPLLDFFLQNKKFPEKIIEDRTGKMAPGTMPNPHTNSPHAPALEKNKQVEKPKKPSSEGDNQ